MERITIEELARMMEQEKLIIPVYQRNEVASRQWQEALIDDVMASKGKHYIAPIIIRVNPASGQWELVDGQQRLKALINALKKHWRASLAYQSISIDFNHAESFEQAVIDFTNAQKSNPLKSSEKAKNLASEEVQEALKAMEDSTFWSQVISNNKRYERREVISQCILLMTSKDSKVDLGKEAIEELTPKLTLEDLKQVNKVANYLTLGVGKKKLAWQKKVHIPCIFRLLAKSDIMTSKSYTPANFIGFLNAFLLGQGTGAEKFSDLRSEYQKTTSAGTSNAIMVEARYKSLQEAYFANNASDFRYNRPSKAASTKPATSSRVSQKAELEALKAEREAQSNKLAAQEAMIKAMQEQIALLTATLTPQTKPQTKRTRKQG